MHFYRHVAVLSVICISMLVLPRLIGNGYHNPLDRLFTNPDGSPCKRPCVFGIRPKRTTADEAIALLKAHPVTKSFAPAVIRFPMGTFTGVTQVGFMTTADGLVDSVMLSTSDLDAEPLLNRAVLGDVIAEFGSPDTVVTFGTTTFLSYGNAQVMVRINMGANLRLLPTEPLTNLLLYNLDCPDNPVEDYLASWLGFVKSARYKAAPRGPAEFKLSGWQEISHQLVVPCQYVHPL